MVVLEGGGVLLIPTLTISLPRSIFSILLDCSVSRMQMSEGEYNISLHNFVQSCRFLAGLMKAIAFFKVY